MELARQARRWGWFLGALPFLLLAAAALLALEHGLGHVLVREDGVLEWLQVAGYVTAVVFTVRLFGRFHTAVDRVLLGAAFLGFFVVIGEEIAWGQRVLHFNITAVVEANKQGDLTLHNIGDGLRIAQVLFLVLAIAAFALPLIAHLHLRSPMVARVLRAPLWLLTWFGVAALYTGVRLVAIPHPSYRVAKISEVAELAVACGLAVVAVLTFRAADTMPLPTGQRHLSSERLS